MLVFHRNRQCFTATLTARSSAWNTSVEVKRRLVVARACEELRLPYRIQYILLYIYLASTLISAD